MKEIEWGGVKVYYLLSVRRSRKPSKEVIFGLKPKGTNYVQFHRSAALHVNSIYMDNSGTPSIVQQSGSECSRQV